MVPCGNIASSFSSLKKSYHFRAAIRPVTFFGVVQGRFAILCACMAALHRERQAHHSEKKKKEQNEGDHKERGRGRSEGDMNKMMSVPDRAKSLNYMYARTPRYTAQKRHKKNLDFKFKVFPSSN